jgi:hypothetical protein
MALSAASRKRCNETLGDVFDYYLECDVENENEHEDENKH